MIDVVRGLVAGHIAGGAGGAGVEPFAVGIETGFGQIGVEIDLILIGKFAGFVPGKSLHSDKFDVLAVVLVFEHYMAEFMENELFEIGMGGVVVDGGGGRVIKLFGLIK